MAASCVVFEVSIARGIGNNPILSVSLRPEINKQDYEIRRIALPIAERYRLKKLMLFGSYARGEATEQSDLDFFADIPDDFGLFRIAELQNDLEDAFHKKIDLVTSGMLNDSLSAQFSQNIEEDEVLLYGGSK